MVDIENNELAVGDEVYYARKQDYSIMCELVKCVITKIDSSKGTNGIVYMDKYVAKMPSKQLLKIKK